MEAPAQVAPIILPHIPLRRTRLARWVTHVGSPPVLGLAGGLVVGFAMDSPAGWQQLGLYVALTWLMPLLFILWLLRRGELSDFNMLNRLERLKPMLMSLVTAVWGWAILLALTAPPLLLALATANLGQSLLYLFITMRWKISIHAAVAASVTVLTWHLWGLAALPVVLSLPLIAWSRVHLRRHTAAQTIAGAAIGAAMLALALVLHGA